LVESWLLAFDAHYLFVDPEKYPGIYQKFPTKEPWQYC